MTEKEIVQERRVRERAYCEYVGKETAEWTTEPGLKKPFTGGRDGRH